MTAFGIKTTNDRSRLMALTPGFRWARMLATYNRSSPSHWVVIHISGNFPFFKASVAFDPEEYKGVSNFHFTSPDSDPDKWEFGPGLKIPEKDWKKIEAEKLDHR